MSDQVVWDALKVLYVEGNQSGLEHAAELAVTDCGCRQAVDAILAAKDAVMAESGKFFDEHFDGDWPALNGVLAALDTHASEAARGDELEKVLRLHHAWHQQVGLTLCINDEIEFDAATEYADSTLCEQTIRALATRAPAPHEHDWNFESESSDHQSAVFTCSGCPERVSVPRAPAPAEREALITRLLRIRKYLYDDRGGHESADAVFEAITLLRAPSTAEAAQGEAELDAECASCGEGDPNNECPKSKRPCGHHCNHSWSHEECCWCGEVWEGIEGAPLTEREPAAKEDR